MAGQSHPHHSQDGHAHEAHDSHSGGSHSGPKLYWTFAAILCAITFAEWIIFEKRVPWGITNQILVPALLVLSGIKFVMVVGWYMHLRHDPGLLKKIFIASLVMGGGTAIVLVILMAKPIIQKAAFGG